MGVASTSSDAHADFDKLASNGSENEKTQKDSSTVDGKVGLLVLIVKHILMVALIGTLHTSNLSSGYSGSQPRANWPRYLHTMIS